MAEMGIYTRNELRDEEGKDPLPGLDEPLTPMNMTTGDPAGDPDNKGQTTSKLSARWSGQLERKSADPCRRETRAFSLSLKATGDDGTIEGYGSVFGVRDNWDDIIAKGAFAASLAAHKSAGTMPAPCSGSTAPTPRSACSRHG